MQKIRELIQDSEKVLEAAEHHAKMFTAYKYTDIKTADVYRICAQKELEQYELLIDMTLSIIEKAKNEGTDALPNVKAAWTWVQMSMSTMKKDIIDMLDDSK